MGEMEGMDVVGFVSLKQVSKKQLDPQCKSIMDQVDQGLKCSPEEKAALIGKPFKTKEEANKKARYLRGQIPLMGPDYAKYGVRIKGMGEAGYQVLGVVKKPAAAGKTGKKKGKPNSGKGKGKAAAGEVAGSGQAVNANATAAALPSPDQIKTMGATNKSWLQAIRQSLENKNMDAVNEPVLKGYGMSKEQYIALVDEVLKQ